MDLVAVLKERSSMTSTAPRAQSIVEHYGVLPAVWSMMSTLCLFLLTPLWDPAAEDWPVPWTTMVELKSGSTSGNSKAFMSFLAEVSLWKPLLSGS